MERLFVYGSLKRGYVHHAELSGARFLGEAVTEPKYELVSLGPYPGLVFGRSIVYGELYALGATALLGLDDFEGALYERRRVLLGGGGDALAYFLRERAAYPAVPGGRW
jgi:gamma-glutamylaminecyclotransferase